MNKAYTPYVADASAWQKHFDAMIANELPYTGGSFRRLRNASPPPSDKQSATVNIINPTQATVDQAKLELKREGGEEVYVTGAAGQHRVVKPAAPPKRRKKSVPLKTNGYDDVLAQP